MIDGGVFLGRNPVTGAALEPEQLIAFMNRYSIASAVAAHYKSIFFDYKEGNQDLLRIAKKYPSRIIPAAVINPNGFDMANDAAYIPGLRKAGFRILGFYKTPRYYEVDFSNFLLRGIAEKAAKAGLIIQLGIENAADLSKICDHFGHLKSPVLIRFMNGRGYPVLAETIHAVQSHPHFLFDAGSFTSSGTIAHLAGTLGAKRLYFSSNIPEAFPFTSHGLLQTSGAGEGALRQICGGTLAKTLSVKTPKINPRPMGTYLEDSFSLPKIDTHWHTGGWNLLEPLKKFEDFEPELKRFNIRKIIVSSIRALNYDVAEGNRSVFELAGKNPRVYGLVVVDPTRLDMTLAEIKKYAKHPKCVGVKTIQDFYGLDLDHDNYRPILESAEKHRLTVMAHIPGLLNAARRCPRLTFVCAHSTHGRVSPMYGTPNIYFDIATSHHDPVETGFEQFFEKAGIDRILFSSDGPLISPAWTLGKLAGFDLTQGAQEKIFRQNALRAFPRLLETSGASNISRSRRIPAKAR